ncbi:AAA family ATPase [Vibrio owensii]|uniref:AAA family ATPase n=1 Tax=Vibrio owensii TaxID=696485 RepID=UPI0022DD280E|nr:AAA family ATPase [Vibrio owensii]MDA0382953.1 AAA family ATPase [Vibrio owensii]
MEQKFNHLSELESEAYLRLIEQHDQNYRHRIHLLSDAHEIFMSERLLSDLTDKERATLLGQKTKMESGDPYDANLFGSPGGSGYVGGIISSGYPYLDEFFAAIPRKGKIDRLKYQRLVDLFLEGVANAGCQIKPFVFFTRILAVVRPDTFVSDAANVLVKHAKALSAPNPRKKFDRYWSEFLLSIHKLKPFRDIVGEPKNIHLAMLDGIEWSEVGRDMSKKHDMPHQDTNHNTILYGPPGTGKTYNTINKALEIVDPEFYENYRGDRDAIKKRFDELLNSNRIGFVTFHQSFSYEDFVEGLKATTENNQVNYEIEDGIFKRLCESARAKPTVKAKEDHVDISDRKIWKMSLGDIAGEDAFIYQQCVDNGYVLLGYGYDIDFSDSVDRKQVAQTYRSNNVAIENESYDYQVTSVNKFKNEMAVGDLIVVSDGNRKFRAIAEITSDYYFDSSLVDDVSYSQARKVTWHRVYEPSLPVDELFKKNLSQMTLYRLYESTIDTEKLQVILQGSDEAGNVAPGQTIGKYQIESISDDLITILKPNGSELPMPKSIVDELCTLVRSGNISIEDIKQKRVFDKVDTLMEKFLVNGYPNVLGPLVEEIVSKGISLSNQASSDKRVLIIDEINRGNISNIFGELITLIEPSKRSGAKEALSVKLPYSKEMFSVPDNLHIIGTMNTADKSLAQIDIALRRRFQFEEMMTNYKLLATIPSIDGIDIKQMVKTINKRIELLYDREHTIGHSFFLPLVEDPSIERLSQIMELEILPLLEEYFFEDWERVAMVLGDHLKRDEGLRFIIEQFDVDEITKLMGDDWELNGIQPYVRNGEALNSPDAYIGIYS